MDSSPVIEEQPRSTYRRGLSLIAAGRVLDNSGQTAAVGLELCHDVIATGLELTLATATDSIIDSIVQYAVEKEMDPTCLSIFLSSDDAVAIRDLEPISGFLVFFASEVLMDRDPTGTYREPHEECTPWPEGAEVARFATANGGTMLPDAVEQARELLVDVDRPEVAVTFGAASVLLQIAWLRSNSDEHRLRALLEQGL